MRRSGSWLLYLFLVAIVAGASGCGSSPATSVPPGVKHLGSVVVGVGSDAGYSGLIIPVNQGFFAKYGVDASVRVFASGAEAQAAMLAGDVDITLSSEVFPVIAKSSGSGSQFSVVTEENSSVNQIALVGHKNIQSAQDLIGKKVAYTAGISSEYFMIKYFAKNNIDKSKVTLVNVAVANIVAVFAKGDVDAMFTIRPRPEQALAAVSGAHVIAWNGDNGVYHLTDFDEFGAKLTANREMAAACMHALLDGEAFLNSYPDRTQTIIVNQLQLDPALVKTGLSVFVTKLQLTPDSLQYEKDVTGWLNSAGRVKTPPDFTNFFNTQPLMDVAPDRVTLKQP
jgi:ABC-type nitrate/sulfonate/bicarbonate transport system substrate-binding protein